MNDYIHQSNLQQNYLTMEQLEELIEIQANFEKNVEFYYNFTGDDQFRGFITSFFKWYDTFGTFKKWEKEENREQDLDIQLDKITDVLFYGLSLFVQDQLIKSDEIINDYKEEVIDNFDDYMGMIDNRSGLELLDYLRLSSNYLMLTMRFIGYYYDLDRVIEVYKNKMKEMMRAIDRK